MNSDALLKLIKSRRSIRRYTDDPISDETIRQLLRAAMWAPSAHNRQPWRFAVVRDDVQKERLAQVMGEKLAQDLRRDGVDEAMITADMERSYQKITGVNTLIVLCMSMIDMDVYSDPQRQQAEVVMAIQSTALAGQNLLLMASEVELGACWMCAPLFCPDVVRTALSLPDDWEPQALITLGYPAEQREKSRDDLEKKVLWR